MSWAKTVRPLFMPDGAKAPSRFEIEKTHDAQEMPVLSDETGLRPKVNRTVVLRDNSKVPEAEDTDEDVIAGNQTAVERGFSVMGQQTQTLWMSVSAHSRLRAYPAASTTIAARSRKL
jgi:hypothetical protein